MPAQPLSYVTNLCTAQACRRTSSDLRSQTPQQAHQTSHYPLYGTSAAATTTAAGCLDGLPRYTRCLSACTHTSKNEEIPVLPGKRAASRIYSSPIRPQHSPSGLHVYPSANHHPLKGRTHQCPGLPRRSHCMGHLYRRMPKGHTQDSHRPPGAWLPNPQNQVSTNPEPTQRLAGLPLGLTNTSSLSCSSKSRQNQKSLSPHPSEGQHNLSRSRKSPGTACVCSSTPPQIKIPKKVADLPHATSTQIRCKCRDQRKTSNSTQNMGIHRCAGGKRPATTTSSIKHGLDRRLTPRLGLPRPRRKCQVRDMVGAAEEASHQCSRTPDHKVCTKQRSGKEGTMRCSLYRQLRRLLRLPEARLHTSTFNARLIRRHPEGPPEERPDTSSKANSGNTECASGCALALISSSNRMGTRRSGLPTNTTMGRTPTGGSHGDSLQHEAPNLRLPLSTPKGGSSGRPNHLVEHVASSIPVPTINHDQPPPSTDTSVQRNTCSGPKPASLDNSSNAVTVLGQRQSTAPLPTFPESGRQDAYCPILSICSMDRTTYLRTTFIRAYGEEVADALLKAFRESTRRQQEHAWRALQEWIRTRPITELALPLLLQFAKWLRTQKLLASQTIAAYKSALALPLREALGLDLSDAHFTLLMKSLFLEKPPSRPQELRWDLNKVLRLLRSPRFQIAKAKEEDLLHKCILLIALATGNRGAELAAFSREGLSRLQNGSIRIAVRQGFLYKNQTADRTPPPVLVQPLPKKPTLPGSES